MYNFSLSLHSWVEIVNATALAIYIISVVCSIVICIRLIKRSQHAIPEPDVGGIMLFLITVFSPILNSFFVLVAISLTLSRYRVKRKTHNALALFVKNTHEYL